jgi:uncharacterized protein YcfJ
MGTVKLILEVESKKLTSEEFSSKIETMYFETLMDETSSQATRDILSIVFSKKEDAGAGGGLFGALFGGAIGLIVGGPGGASVGAAAGGLLGWYVDNLCEANE